MDPLPERERFRAIGARSIQRTPQWQCLPPELQEAVQVVARVLPFRTNAYVMEQLIDWSRVPDDPIYQLTFGQRGMLDEAEYERMALALRRGDRGQIEATAATIRQGLNPHPSGQATHNVPRLDGRPLPGVQHKYRETVLFFPSAGQTCHAYCSFCFRWAQFVGPKSQRFEAREAASLTTYLAKKPQVSDLLVTGGDPMIMGTATLRRYLEPLLTSRLDHLTTIRLGSKSLAFWPQRFVTDGDADELLRLFEDIVASGRHLALMAHVSHPVELSTPLAQQAIRRLRDCGVQIRTQSPLIRHVNDAPTTWAQMWRRSVQLGMVPYYMFVERDTGPNRYFEVPLVKGWEIFRHAYQQVSGLARTVRGPCMSALPGKILIDGTANFSGERVLALQFLQGRDADWVRRPFYARYDPAATWLDDLQPAFGDDLFFFEREDPAMVPHRRRQCSDGATIELTS